MAEGEILENYISTYGLRRLHVANGDPLDRKAWIEKVPWYARQVQKVLVREWREELLGIHHLELYWHCRDLININKGKRPGYAPGLVWWLADCTRLRDALPTAVEAFLGYSGKLPGMVLMRTKGDAPDVYVEPLTGLELVLRAADWVPEKFVCLV